MENKSDAVRREILKNILERYGNKPKKILVKEIKDRGVYKQWVDDDEIYSLVRKFAEFHNISFGYTEPIKPPEPVNEIEEMVEQKEDIDLFFKSLLKERDNLSKKLLILNKLIDTYNL